MRILLIGHGRMGQIVAELAPSYGCTIASIVTSQNAGAAIAPGAADVAIDFSLPAAVASNFQRLADARINVVIGTTGWHGEEAALRQTADAAGLGVLSSANFAIGMSIFQLVVERAAGLFASLDDVGAWIHEAHHSAKKDAPSGTALMLKTAMTGAGYDRSIDVSSTRAGAIPGTHTVGFDGPSETVALTHTVRDRAVFARGALEAAKWLRGRRGWFTIKDMLGDHHA
jgi:4-hydroxy-tetrahydrodipicolinate reductase